MEHTITCEQCGITKTVEIRIPKTCSNSCRLVKLAEGRRAVGKQNKLNKETHMENENSNATGEVNNKELDTPASTEVVEVPLETTHDGQESGGGEGTDHIGQGTTEADRVDTPSEPTANTGGEQGQT